MFTPAEFGKVSVLVPENGGAVPYGNTVVVHGSESTLVIDPSLSLDRDPVGADLAFISHGHEDHIAGLHHFDVPTFAHHLDAPSVASLETLLDNYGLRADERTEVRQSIATQYGIPPTHQNVAGIADGHVFELGDRTATVIHLPGHTRGHCGVLVEPDGFFYVADIDLTSFGPMYGDLGSSVNDFLDSIDHVATIDARWYGTFHQKGVVEGSDEFRRRLTAYREKLLSREERLVRFLSEPKRLEDIVAHRLVYRPHVAAPYVDAVERRTAQLHLERLIASGAVTTDEDKVFRRAL